MDEQTSENCTAAAEAVLENAKRLLADAELLFERERYPTALALGVLSIEEIGKCELISEGKISAARNHLEKQDAFISSRFTASLGDYLLGFVESIGGKLIHESLLTEKQKARLETPGVQAITRQYYSGEMPDARYGNIPMAKAMALHIERHFSSQVVKRIQARELSKLKEHGFYLDISDDGSVTANPSQIDKAQAEEVISVARWYLNWCDRANSLSPMGPI